MIGNAPAWYKLHHLRNQLIVYLCVYHETLVEDLQVHLNKTVKSLQQIIFNLFQDEDVEYAIDFVILALSLMLDIPILMVRLIQYKNAHGGIHYTYQEKFPTTSQQNKTWPNSKI